MADPVEGRGDRLARVGLGGEAAMRVDERAVDGQAEHSATRVRLRRVVASRVVEVVFVPEKKHRTEFVAKANHLSVVVLVIPRSQYDHAEL